MHSSTGHRLRWLTLLVAIPMILGCPQRAHVWVEPGSTSVALVFRVGAFLDKPGMVALGTFAVERCAPNDTTTRMWLVYADELTDKVDRIVYGAVPPAFTQKAPARQLTPGCYIAAVGGSPGRRKFIVNASGAITSLGESF
jgi:hypothetical protein